MPIPAGPDPIVVSIPLTLSVVTGVGDYVVYKLEDTVGGAPSRVVLATPGQIAWDNCDCGQFAQTITSVASSSAFPTPSSDVPVRGCGHAMQIVSVTASLIRCITGPVNGTSPSPDWLMRDALILEEWRAVLRRSIVCHLKSLRDSNPMKIYDFTVGPATSVGPEGLCGGLEINYSFAVTNEAMCC